MANVNDEKAKVKLHKRRFLVVNNRLQLVLIAYMLGLTAMSSVLTMALMQMIAMQSYIDNMTSAYLWLIFLTILMVGCWAAVILLFTNKIFGPLYRLHKEMTNWKDGKPVSTIQLRRGDYFTELVDDFNHVVTHHANK